MKNKKLATTLLSTAMVVSITVPTAVRANEMSDAENIVEQSQEQKNTETLESVEGNAQEANQEEVLENQEDTNETQEVSAQALEQPETENHSVEKAVGTTIYVDGYRTGNGDDNNSGTSQDQPVKTLKHALDLAGENGTVIILDTVYITEDTVLDNNVTIKRGGTCAIGMIYIARHALTINHATIDGNKQEYPQSSQMIADYGDSDIYINEGAKLCNNGEAAIRQMATRGTEFATTVTMNGGEICDNDSGSYSNATVVMDQPIGELYINGGSIHDNKTGAIKVGVPIFNMTGGKIYNNDNSGESFGGIRLMLATKGVISGGEIYGNKSYNGGGISMIGSTQLTVSGNTSIHDNTVTGDGSAIYAEYNTSIVIEDGVQITGNKGTGDASGGAIALSDSASATIGQATISNNSAQYGGGIAAYSSGTVTLNGTIIKNNTALSTGNWGNGGGISINKTGTLNINDAVIEGNHAHHGGGLIAYDTAVVNINGNTSIKNNQAPADGGGGIVSGGSATVNLNSATISGNKALYGSGIGIWNNGKVIMKKDVSIIQNIVTSTNSNSAGGAIYVEGNSNGGSQFIMEDGLIKDNTTTGGVHCAGIFVNGFKDQALVKIKGGTIIHNVNENGDDQSIVVRASEDNQGNVYLGKLELSGSPTITGQVLLRKDTSKDIKVDVVDTFNPTQPVAISLSNDDWTNHSVIATYVSNVTPNKEMFKPYQENERRYIAQNKHDLECMNKVKVTFKNDDGSSNKEVYVMPNGKVKESNAPTLTKTGYIFNYWKNEKDGKEWNFAQNEVAEEDIVLVPEWQKDTTVDHFIVKYVTNSSELIADLKVTKGNKATKPQLSNPEKGLVVEGWYTTATFEEGTKWNFDHPVKSDMTLYAKWVLKKPTGTLEAEGNVTTVHTGKTVKLIATANHESTGNITYSYQWYKDGKKLDSKARAATGTNEIEVSETGSYTVKITASDGTYTSSALDVGPVEVKITDHSYTGNYKYDENTHWRECDECGKKEEGSHTYGEWKVVKEATKSEKGLAERECVLCGHKQTKETTFNEPIVPGNNTAPTIDAKDVEITVGQTFDAMKYATAKDAEDGDLTEKIKVVRNNVDTSKAGTYEVTYLVTDKEGATATKTIKVTVKEKADKDEQKQQEEVTKQDKKVKTGDETHLISYLMMTMMSLVSGTFLFIKNYRKD